MTCRVYIYGLIKMFISGVRNNKYKVLIPIIQGKDFNEAEKTKNSRFS